jgi:hypothetical protein
MNENWKPVPGYEGKYEVSDLGKVRSLKSGEPRLLRPGLCSNGYVSVSLERKTHLVQHIVAQAFIGPRRKDALVLHNNGDRRDNRSSNLRYGTASENNHDTTLHERRKLSIESVKSIRALHGDGVPKVELAERFGVSRRQISNVVRRVQYGSIL